jgi:hypothetical protein
MECRDTQISCIAARVWQRHPRHADPRKVPSQEHPEALGRAIRHAPHREAFIPDVKILGRSSELKKAMTKPEEGLAS